MNIRTCASPRSFKVSVYDELQQLMDNAKPLSLRAGEVLIKQGDLGDSAFVVLKGVFEITKQWGQILVKN